MAGHLAQGLPGPHPCCRSQDFPASAGVLAQLGGGQASGDHVEHPGRAGVIGSLWGTGMVSVAPPLLLMSTAPGLTGHENCAW